MNIVSTIITAGSVLGVVITLFTLAWKMFKWIEHQKEQDQELSRIENKFNEKIAALEEERENERRATQEELTLIIYGLQACLKGLNEQGCDGPVTDAIQKIDKHLNQRAHQA